MRVSASLGGLRNPLTVSAAGAADMMRPAEKKRTMRVVVMRDSLTREVGGEAAAASAGGGIGTVADGVTTTGCGADGSGELDEVL